MKLYTEEQVREAIMSINTFKYMTDSHIDDIIYSLTPIELPSDDEICEEAESISHNYFVMQMSYYEGLQEGSRRMAYWLMKRFKQQDNEQ